MKIQFDIKYRPQIESGEYKVETRDGRSVEIVKWDFRSRHGNTPILAIIHGDYDYNHTYSEDGYSIFESDKLFIVTPEEELTEFEKKLWEVLKSEGSPIGPVEKFTNADKEVFHSYASELLSLAREQFIKDGYVIEKKAFHDAVEKADPEVIKEVSKNVDMQIALRTEYEKGRADALKDLPRWKKATGKERFNERMIVLVGDNDLYCTNYAEEGEYYISFPELEKLPKEDEQ